MKSQTSLIASQCRLQQWAKQIRDCQNRPADMQVAEWCEMNGITTANYYYRLRRVRESSVFAGYVSDSSLWKGNIKTERLAKI